MSDWIPFACSGFLEACLWDWKSAAEIRQPGVEATGKRAKYAFQDGWLVTAGFYGASTMKAFFKWKYGIESDTEKALLNELKTTGLSNASKQYIQIESERNGLVEYET